MDEVLAALDRIQREMNEQKIMIQKSAETVTENVTENINRIMDEKFKIWEERHENLKQRVDNQELRLYHLEKQARQRNLVFFGLEEDEKSYLDMEKKIISFIQKYLSVKIDARDLQAIRRIGKKADNPRPVAVTFTTLGTKIEILKHKAGLKDSLYYIKEDYPQQVLKKRKELQAQVRIEREKGNTAIIKYDKLVILKNKPSNL